MEKATETDRDVLPEDVKLIFLKEESHSLISGSATWTGGMLYTDPVCLSVCFSGAGFDCRTRKPGA